MITRLLRWLIPGGKEKQPSQSREDDGIEGFPYIETYANQPAGLMSTHWWRTVLAGVFGLVIAVSFLVLFWLLAYQFALIVLGISIAAALSPLVSKLQRHMPRLLAVLLVYLVILLIFAGTLAMIIPPLVNQGQEIAQQAPAWIEQVEVWAEEWRLIDEIPRLIEFMYEEVERIGTALVSVPVGIARAGFDIFIILVVSVYSLLEGLSTKRFIQSLFPEDLADKVISVLAKMLHAMGGFVQTVAINAAVIGLLTYLGLLIIGVDFPLVLGLFAGMMEVIPYLGPIIAAIPILIVALFDSPTTALITFAFLIVLQQFESYVFLPYVMRTQTKVSPLAVVVALIIGGALGGLMGVLVALPLMAALTVFIVEVAAPAIQRDRTTSKQEGRINQYSRMQ
jgi:predicted PurR-regulated permease PerM